MTNFLAIVLLCASLLTGGRAVAEEIELGYLPLLGGIGPHAAALDPFKKAGLDVATKAFQSGPALAQALIAGDYQVGELGLVPMLHLAAQGAPLYFVATAGINSAEHPSGAIMVRPDETGIRSFQDLKGKKIGQLGLGTLTYMRLLVAARHFGMKPDDFQQIFVPFPQMGALLATKQVDAVYAYPPFDTLIAQAGQGKTLVDDTEWIPYDVAGALAVNKIWADHHPDQVRKITRIWIETARFLADHPAEARADLVRSLKLPEAVARAVRLPYWPRNGYILMPSVWDTYYLMVDTKQLAPVENIQSVMAAYVTDPAKRWITPVLDEIGRQPDPYAAAVEKIALPDLPRPPAEFVGPWEK